jgi:acetyltransferase-like isoleucine patch superfamily enzyme
MRAYRVATGRVITPFGDLARALHVADAPLATWQEEACRACGLEVVDVASLADAVERPAIAFLDDVFFSEMALRQFVAGVLHEKTDAVLAVHDSAVLRAVRVLDDEPPLDGGVQRFEVFFLASAASSGPSDPATLLAGARPIAIEAVERTTTLRLPADDRVGEAAISARVVAKVRHWLHLLRLSHLAIGVRLLDGLRRRPGLALKLRLLRRRGPWELARHVTFVHPTARVHPTADLESAIIGPGAIVHAHAHVHRSIIGANVEIGDHAAVVGCTLAERVQVLRASYLSLCAALPGATLASYKVQLSLFGRDVFLTSSAWLIDAKLAGDVAVEHEGRLVSTGTPYLGVCVGHRVTLGAQVTILAGRAVPNGLTIVAPPERFARALPAFPEGTIVTIRNGTLEPV